MDNCDHRCFRLVVCPQNSNDEVPVLRMWLYLEIDPLKRLLREKVRWVGPNLTGIFIRRRDENTKVHKERPCEGTGRKEGYPWAKEKLLRRNQLSTLYLGL